MEITQQKDTLSGHKTEMPALPKGIEASLCSDEIERQYQILSHPPVKLKAERACTVGDGILALSEEKAQSLAEKARQAIHEGRVSDFIPASGAASRMFAPLLAALKEPEVLKDCAAIERKATAGAPEEKPVFGAVLRFFENLPRFPFYSELALALHERTSGAVDLRTPQGFEEIFVDGRAPEVIRLLLEEADGRGLNFANLPKAVLPFHRSKEGVRTALEEHLRNGVEVGGDVDGVCRIHFTRSPGHAAVFDELVGRLVALLKKETGLQFQVTFSVQDPATDTLSLTHQGEILISDNTLILRPGGHGALLGNLERTGGDIVYINNIDNVQPEGKKERGIQSKLTLVGQLLEVQADVFSLLRETREQDLTDHRLRAVKENLLPRLHLGVDEDSWYELSSDEQQNLLFRLLNRPIRVVGVVKNDGEPGGGPFWAPNSEGHITPQILEQQEFDPSDPKQKEILQAGTHFNPVRLVCGLKNFEGKPFELSRYVNNNAVLIAEKTFQGEPIRVLERPGLWNGSMADWITLFVEVDGSTFTPVKTVFDLLREVHQVG